MVTVLLSSKKNPEMLLTTQVECYPKQLYSEHIRMLRKQKKNQENMKFREK